MLHIEWSTIGAFAVPILSFVAGFVARAFNIGRTTEAVTGRITHLERAMSGVQTDLSALAKKDEAQSAANAGAVALFREQHRDFQNEALKTFATKTELERHERVSNAAYERLDRKMDDLGQQIRSLPAEIVAMVRGAGA